MKIQLLLARQWEKSRVLILIGLAIAVLAIVAMFLLPQLGTEQSGGNGNDQVQNEARKAASKIAAHYTDKLKAISSELDNAQTTDLLSRQDQDEIDAYLKQVSENNKEVLGIHLLNANEWSYQPGLTPPITYASMALLDKARESGKAPRPEALLFGSKNQHIAWVLPVSLNNEEKTRAYYLVGLAHSFLKSSLKQIPPAEGVQLIIRQPVQKGNDLILAKQAGTVDGRKISLAIPGTRWQLDYVNGESRQDTGNANNTMLIAAAAAVLVLLAVIALLFKKKSRQPEPEPMLGGAAENFDFDGDVDKTVTRYLEKTTTGAVKKAPVADESIEDQALAGAGEVDDDFGDVFGELDDDPAAADSAPTVEEDTADASSIPAEIFRMYDIRGKAITPDLARSIGQAIGSEAFDRGQQSIVVGRDGRQSSPELAKALIEGIRSSGRDVIDVGMVPTPLVYYATHYLETGSGVMVTASHNPKEHNGFKIVLDGKALSEDGIQGIRKRVESNDFQHGAGNLQNVEVDAEYIRKVTEDIPVALGTSYKLVIDCGNGVAGNIAPRLFNALGHDIVELYCEVDGEFPNHHPDPSQLENMQALIDAVKENSADLGLAFDGDGDRLGVVDANGQVYWPDQLSILFAQQILKDKAGATIIYDVKCSSLLGKAITEAGGNPLMSRTGHSLMRAKIAETDAALATDMSGHIFFNDRWFGFDDAMYSGARLLELLMASGKSPTEVLAELPVMVTTPEIRVELPAGKSGQQFMEQLSASGADFAGASLVTIDGIRAEYDDGWGLVRASNTLPVLTLRFEAQDDAAMQRIQSVFRSILTEQDSSLELPF